MKLIYTILLVGLSSIAFSQEDCIDPSIIDQDVICPGIFAPVCGCDGETYSNSCVAQNYHGVTSWVDGECPPEPECMDLAGIDFGVCAMPLGIAMINGTCQSVSGCSTEVDGVDYAPYFFTEMEDCISCAQEEVNSCEELSGVDFGPCDAVLGYGVVDGTCQTISGCSPVAQNGIDYSVALHDSPEECEAACGSEVDECEDLEGVDFGLCEMLLGYGIVDGSCQAISGCSTTAENGIDYSEAIHDNPKECAAICGGEVDECEDLEGIDFGLCDLVLGYGIVDGTCQAISGCSTTAENGIDYSEAIHDSPEDCVAVCGNGGSDCLDLSEVDFGDCAMPLGYIWNGYSCDAISGCSMIGADGVDYSEYFSQDLEECASCYPGCINEGQIDESFACTEEYDPVCGCDNSTYDNECYAYYFGGVTSWTEGECGTVGVDESEEEKLVLYPTVFENELRLKGRVKNKSNLIIFNTLGEIVLEEILEPAQQEIQVPPLAEGLYHYSITSGGKMILNGKLVKSD